MLGDQDQGEKRGGQSQTPSHPSPGVARCTGLPIAVGFFGILYCEL